jgi:TusA-related sulfurtransferase
MSAQGNKENMRRVLREAFGQGNLAMMMPVSAEVEREGALTELDVRGSVCPGPTGDTLAALKELPVGGKLVVISDYLPARQTIPRLIEKRGCSWRITEDDGKTFRMEIVKGE